MNTRPAIERGMRSPRLLRAAGRPVTPPGNAPPGCHRSGGRRPGAPPRARWPDAPGFTRPGALAAICTAYFMVILDTTAVNVAVPRIGHELGGGVAAIQWVLDSYTVVFAALLLSGGALGDRLGQRRVFTVGLGGFVVGSALCGMAPTLALLIGARVLQAVAAAAAVPASLGLLRSAYPAPGDRARAFGWWGAVAGVAAASGPVVGGLLTSALGWRAVFLVNLPVGLAGIGLARHHLADSRPQPARRADGAGQVLAMVCLAALVLGVIEAGEAGWSSPPSWWGMAAFLLAGAGFIVVERRSRAPLMPPGLAGNRSFSAANAVGLLLNLSFYGQLFVMSVFLQGPGGRSALGAGLALLPESVAPAIASWASGRVAARFGQRLPMAAGLAVAATGYVCLAGLGLGTGYVHLVLPMAAVGLGTGFTMPAATVTAIESAGRDRSGLAAAAVNAARQVGGAVGVALLGGPFGPATGTGSRVPMLVAATAAMVGAAIALFHRAPAASGHGDQGER